MKRQIIFIFWSLTTVCSFAQVNYLHNHIRVGDEIIKQQVSYKDPGREGENVIWDFSRLSSINNDYSLTYNSVESEIFNIGNDTLLIDKTKEEIVVGIEHSTMYYYKQDSSKLSLLGYENPTTLVYFKEPSVQITYPFNLNKSFESNFKGEGNYSNRLKFAIEGNNQNKVDASGMMILPSGDTLRHTLRIKTIEQVKNTVFSGDEQSEHDLVIERYKWYTKGYRYPIFETITTKSEKDSINNEEFSSSFFFPPQDHYYLDYDKDNSLVLDSLWNDQNKKEPNETIPDIPDQSLNFTYNFYPNPVLTFLTLEYYLEKKSDVNISIFSISGKLLKTINKPNLVSGIYSEQIDFQSYSPGNYIISISTGRYVHSDKIIKR